MDRTQQIGAGGDPTLNQLACVAFSDLLFWEHNIFKLFAKHICLTFILLLLNAVVEFAVFLKTNQTKLVELQIL